MALRPQYHFRPSANGYFAWSIKDLIRLAEPLPAKDVLLSDIGELDEAYWFDGHAGIATIRAVADHARLIDACELSYPILLCADGRLMDGAHRLAKAYLTGRETILAKRFNITPAPGWTDVRPEDLDYSE